MSMLGLLLLGALLGASSADAGASAPIHSRVLLTTTPRPPVCTPPNVVTPTTGPKVCPVGTTAVARDAAGRPTGCVVCPEGYQFNSTRKLCVLVKCPGNLQRFDNDGLANGRICCSCPNFGFPLFLRPASGVPACYPRCPSNTIQIDSPVPKCCSKYCPVTDNGVQTVPTNPVSDFCKIPGTSTKVPRNCRARAAQAPQCTTLNATVEPTPWNLTCRWDTLEVTGADGNTTCWLCSSGAASLDVNGTVVCPPGLGKCPGGYTRCGGYCWNSQDWELRTILKDIPAARCSKFLSNFAKCVAPCFPPNTTTTRV